MKKTEYEGSDESTIYLEEIQGITSRQVEILSKAEIHTSEDFLNTDLANIIILKGLGKKTAAKITDLIQAKVDNQSDTIKDAQN